LNFVPLSLRRGRFGLNGGFGANSRLYLPLLLTLSLAGCFRFRLGLNGGFGVSYRLMAFGFSALFCSSTACICLFVLALYLPQCLRRFRFGLNGGFGGI
jgi:hypothetical protein